MNVTGLVAEFNPFHNGHAYIINKIKEQSDAVVVIMSGNFVQRGDVAITDKHTRTKTALKNGADLVIELPVIYALNTAQRFAYGAIKTLDSTGVVTSLAFGSECGDIKKLYSAAKAAAFEAPEISGKIKKLISSGMNYPSARAKAYTEFADIWDKPNNILAVEYLRAIIDIKSNIKPFTIQRTNDFHSINTDGNIISATAIRTLIKENKDTAAYMPKTDFDIYSVEKLDNVLNYILRNADANDIATINDVTEGLENRIISASAQNLGFYSIAEAVKSKRYTMSRIRRILLGIILNLDKDLCASEPSYIRVLGMNNTGMELLKCMKAKATLPVIVKTADFNADKIFKAEIRATETASLCKINGIAAAHRDYCISPVIVKN